MSRQDDCQYFDGGSLAAFVISSHRKHCFNVYLVVFGLIELDDSVSCNCSLMWYVVSAYLPLDDIFMQCFIHFAKCFKQLFDVLF